MARRVLITGCSTGIGRALAEELTARGDAVIATARSLAALEGLDVAEKHALNVDLDEDVRRVRDAVGVVDVLINNAGFGIEGPVETASLDDVRKAFETNFFGAVRMIQAFVPDMREQGSGVVVNVTSVAGIVSPPLAGFYGATKFALEAVSETLHFEVGHFGVKVMVVEPGGVETQFSTNMIDERLTPGPYLELGRQWEGAMDRLRGGQSRPTPDTVAVTVANALAQDDLPFRLPVGADAEMIAATRASMSFEAMENAMRTVMGVDW